MTAEDGLAFRVVLVFWGYCFRLFLSNWLKKRMVFRQHTFSKSCVCGAVFAWNAAYHTNCLLSGCGRQGSIPREKTRKLYQKETKTSNCMGVRCRWLVQHYWYNLAKLSHYLSFNAISWRSGNGTVIGTKSKIKWVRNSTRGKRVSTARISTWGHNVSYFSYLYAAQFVIMYLGV